MRGTFYIPLLVLMTSGCMALYQPADSNRIKSLYDEQIRDWQRRINQEGWEEELIDEVAGRCVKFSRYRPEKEDHWDTPKEFMEKGFQGDCEDIAVFMMAALKRLRYPHKVRIMAVSTLIGDHAILRVEMPDGKWKVYETVPMPLDELDQLFYRPIVEFDETAIYYFEIKGS